MTIQERASGMFARLRHLADELVSPAKREQYWNQTTTFAQKQPLLLTFLLVQLLLSATPILLFLSFTLGTLALALSTAIFFSLFWVGVALLVLIPTLFVTVSLGIALWVWAVSSFLVARWVYNSALVSIRGKTEIGLPNGKKIVVKKHGDGVNSVEGKVEEVEDVKREY